MTNLAEGIDLHADPLPVDTPLTEYPCYGQPKKILLSWSRLSDYIACNYRVRLIHEGKKSRKTNARNFLAGKVTDLCMRHALDNAEKDSEGRLLSLSLDELMDPLPEIWDNSVQKPEKNTVMQWLGADPVEDQKRILNNVHTTLRNLHPILTDSLMGRRFIPEMRPKFEEMPVIGIPGPDGETCYIRLFLAVDCAVQLEEGDSSSRLGKWGLYDLKTTSTKDYISKTLPQLVFYDLAFHAMSGSHPVDHALWTPLLDPSVQRVHVTDEHRRQMLSWIISYCHGVWAGKDGFTTDEKNCYTCPTKTACPKIVTPITKDEQGISRAYFGQPNGGKLHD